MLTNQPHSTWHSENSHSWRFASPFNCSSFFAKAAFTAQLIALLRFCLNWHQRKKARVADFRHRCIQKKKKEAVERTNQLLREIFLKTMRDIYRLTNTPASEMTDWEKHQGQELSIESGKRSVAANRRNLANELSYIESWYNRINNEKELNQVLIQNSHSLQAKWGVFN